MMAAYRSLGYLQGCFPCFWMFADMMIFFLFFLLQVQREFDDSSRRPFDEHAKALLIEWFMRHHVV